MPKVEDTWVVNTTKQKTDHLRLPKSLTKLDDLGVPTIDYKIEGSTLYETFCDMGSSVNIMSKMVDQSYWKPEGITKDVMINIIDHYDPADFLVLDMGEEDDIHIILGRPFLNTTSAIMRSGEI